MNRNIANRWVLLVLILLGLTLASKFFPNRILNGAVVGLGGTGLLLFVILLVRFISDSLKSRRQENKNRKRADKWKLRICSFADSTVLPEDGTTYKTLEPVMHFC